jgi:hypothetical protein
MELFSMRGCLLSGTNFPARSYDIPQSTWSLE